MTIVKTSIPQDSEIRHSLATADFYDCYELPLDDDDARSAMEVYLNVVSRTPAWINGLMSLRNRAVTLFGLKDLGGLGAVDSAKAASSYRKGERVGIFSILYLENNEVILGDCDKHLDVKVSVCKVLKQKRSAVAVSTIVHVHNNLGRAYMALVTPFHRLIVPALLSRSRGIAKERDANRPL